MAQLPASTAADPLGPGSYCANCGVGLVHGARWCHRCGVAAGTVAAGALVGAVVPAPAGAGEPAATVEPAAAPVLPWAVAFVALMAVVAVFAGRSFASSRSTSTGPAARPVAEPTGTAAPAPGAAAPDISNMSAEERADRLYERVMVYEAQDARDSLLLFAPMAMSAHELLSEISLERRYHVGQAAEASGVPELALAQADTILAADDQHLLGLVLAARARRLLEDTAGARAVDQRLVRAATAAAMRSSPAYDLHRLEIEAELAIARRSGDG